MKTNITIITVVFNGENSIESTIKNVLRLKETADIEFIIIDGGSKDGTVEIIKRYDRHISYWISEPDHGIYDAMNKGWGKANPANYILYLGSGDTVINLPELHQYEDYDVIYGDVELEERYLFKSNHSWKLRLGNTVHHQALLIRKKLHPLPPFSLSFKTYADFDFNQRLYKSGASFIKDNTFRSFALIGGISTAFNRQESLKVVRKNFGVLYQFLASVYYILQDVRKTR